MSVYSDRSSRTSSTKSSASSAMSMTPYRTSTPPVITALPSFTHSLSAFPSMTSVTNDMVSYGTLGRTKSVSEARLNSALQTTKQRRDTLPHMTSATSPPSPTDPDTDDEETLVIRPRKSRGVSQAEEGKRTDKA
ncbi:hypothetical protein NM688_g5276 [Phlebia brevispora]|uniref:Uncharacterized protein n=1 Tax=Phlebia brevispora TaxID=194682 RepID=A0ACC1SXW4_9APHY|nr:hypothetical protein NM688_g5276 [Phlebia brevispora]